MFKPLSMFFRKGYLLSSLINLPFDTPLLTPPQGVSVPSGGTAPGRELGFQPTPQPNADLNPRRCPRKKCDDDLDDPRLDCFKGLYKEGRTDTEFTSWIQIDCETGRELVDNVVPFRR